MTSRPRRVAPVKIPEPPTNPVVRILLVDDDPLMLNLIAEGLSAKGYAVDTAPDGTHALARAAAGSHDLAVVDIRLPDISGIEVARRLRESFDIPALFLSAHDDEDTVREAVGGGGLGYLVKPVAFRQFLPGIESALARARDLRALEETRRHLQQALESGRDTCTAVGILMGHHGLGREAAFQRLRAEARSQRCSVEALAGKIVAATDTLNALK